MGLLIPLSRSPASQFTGRRTSSQFPEQRRNKMPVRPPIDPRDRAAEQEVLQLVEEFPGQLDFYDVVNKVPKRSKVFKQEAKSALVYMINRGVLFESANRKISAGDKDYLRRRDEGR
jgi:hypothetical protein